MANEKRLIDANDLIDWLSKYTGFRGNCEDCTDIDCLDCIIENAIKNAPTVDAVEVVRCKECKHWLHVEEGFGDCTNPRFHLHGHADPTMNADNFCSCGERRTEG